MAGGGVSVTSFSAGTTGLTPTGETTGAVTLGGTLAVANGGTNNTSYISGAVPFSNGTTLTSDTSKIFFDNSNNRIGFGTNVPLEPFHLRRNFNGGSIMRFDNLSTGDAASARVQVINNQETIGQLATFGSGFGFNIFEIPVANYSVLVSSGDNSNGLLLGSITEDPVIFGTNGTQRMRITSGGNVGIGTASPLSKLNVIGTVRINSASAPDANYYLQLENSSSQKAKANAWDTYSDSRIKTDIQPIVNAIDKVNLLNPVYYQKHDSYVENDFLNIDYDSSVKSLGFIAQEVYNIIPEAVNTGTTNELWAMDYTKIIPILTKAIQEQNALIKTLEQRILTLENK